MRPLPRFPRPSRSAPLEQRVEWLLDRYDEIVTASQQESLAVGDPFTVSNLPAAPSRALDAANATPEEVRVALATLIADMRRRGMNRGTG